MSNSGWHRKRRGIEIIGYALVIAAVFLFLYNGVAVGSSGEGSAAKGWVRTDTYKVINFALLCIGLIYLLRKPASQALNGRINGIKEQLSELEAKKKAAEKQLAEYNEKFLQLDKEAEKIIAEYVKQGNEAKTRIIEEAEAAAQRLEAQARKNIEQEFEKTRQKLRGEVLDQALVKAEEIIKSKITTRDQNRLVDEYLDKVVA